MLERTRFLVAEGLSLRWARLGGRDVAIPLGAIVVTIHWWDELHAVVLGDPAWVAALMMLAAVLLGWLAALRIDRQTSPGRAIVLGLGIGVAAGVAAIERSALGVVDARYLLAWTLAATLAYAAGRVAARPAGRPMRWSALELGLVAWVVALWLVFDAGRWSSARLYDLDVYLDAGARWLAGGQPYMTAVLHSWPAGPSQDYFLYPPPLLPLFALLSELPRDLVAACWVSLLAACGLAALRAIGLSWGWSLVLLAFPPFQIGFESGNVAPIALLLFALGARLGGGLVVDGIFKVQTGLPALFLVRNGRWRALAAGAMTLAGVVALTLPIVGLASWQAWLVGLGYRADSQALAPALFGQSYARYLPGWAFVLVSIGAVMLALIPRGRRSLAALGVATIFASPSLWPHGFLFALPAILLLQSGTAVWLALGAAAIGANVWYLPYVGALALLAAPRRLSGAAHPLRGTEGPWPAWPDAGAPVEDAGPARPRPRFTGRFEGRVRP